MAIIECPECNKHISSTANSCPACGFMLRNVSTPKSRSIAVLLSMLGGILGLHKFYMNRPGLGVLYLCFSWTFIPALLGFIEGFIYLTQTDQEFSQKYFSPRPNDASTPQKTTQFSARQSPLAEFFLWFIVAMLLNGIFLVGLGEQYTGREGLSVYALPLAVALTISIRYLFKMFRVNV